MDLKLKNKRALITGGSKGIGLAVAQELAAEGVNLILCARDKDILVEKANQISDNHKVEVDTYGIDVSKAEEIQSLLYQIKSKYDSLDIFFSNAGQGSEETIAGAPDERWQYYWDLHVMAAVRLSRGLLPLMSKNGGAIIMNSSICARQPLGHEPIYNTTKAALSMFSKCLANEFITHNIRVNTVNPGMILTEAWENAAEERGKKEGLTAKEYLDKVAYDYTPIGRFATSEELAKFIVFLCSPTASYCVGSTYYVDGGWLRVVN